MNVSGARPGQVLLFDWDAHRVMRIAPPASSASTRATHFDLKLKKWDVQTAAPEPANIDFLFAMATDKDLAEAARFYAIAYDMLAQQRTSAISKSVLHTPPTARAAAAAAPAPAATAPSSSTSSVFDVTAVPLDALNKALGKLAQPKQDIVRALHKEYLRRNEYKHVIPIEAVALKQQTPTHIVSVSTSHSDVVD